MAYKIIVADDHDIIREGIKSLLRDQEDFELVAEATDGEDVLEKAEKFKPDILLLDITMPKKSGLDLIGQLYYILPDIKIIIVSMHRANIYVTKAFKLGVKGFIHKENVVEELIPALRCICRGQRYVSSKLSQYLIGKITKEGGKASQAGLDLTEREKDILRLVVEGKTAKEIAEILFISPRTVENYKNTLLKKLGLHKTSELINYAIQNKIVEAEE